MHLVRASGGFGVVWSAISVIDLKLQKAPRGHLS